MTAHLRTIHGINDFVSTFCGLFCNSLLIYMIVKTKDKELQKYNAILLQSTFIDLVLTILTFIVRPIIVTYHGQEVIIVNSLIPISQQAEQLLSAVWIFVIVYSICVLPISFYYRYRILCLNKKFPFSLQLTCLVISGFMAITYAGHYYYAFCIRTKDKLHLAEELAPWFATEDGKVKATSIMGIFDNYVYFFMSHAVLITFGSYIIVIYLSWKVYKFMKFHKVTMMTNPNFLDVQSQLTKTLVAQSIIPLITFGIPVICVVVTVVLAISVPPVVSAATFALLSYIPMGNALSMLFFDKELKKYNAILLQCTIVDIFFNTMTFIARPIVVTQDGRESIILNSLIPMSHEMEQYVSAVWVMALVYSMDALPTSFYYRYRILCLNKKFPLSLQLTCLAIAGFMAVTFGLHYYYAFCIRTKDKLYLAEELAPWFAADDGKVKATSIMGIFDKYLYIIMFNAVIVICGSYIIIICLSWKVYKFMKYHQSSMTVNPNFLEVQNQLTKTLIAQSVIPLFTFVVPLIGIVITITSPLHISPSVSGIASIFLSYIPMGNALSILFFLKSYRKESYMMIKNCFGKLRQQRFAIVATTSSLI